MKKFLLEIKQELIDTPNSVKFWNLMVLVGLVISGIFSLDLLVVELFIGSFLTLGLAIDGVSTKEGAQTSLKKLDDALVHINGVRANFGALQNRLQSTTNNLEISDENLSAANSRIRDVDVAAETADMTKNNILLQAGVSVLSQANQSPNMALKLLQS
jgi:flagellin-like hook-associated protein FlgL